MKIQVNDIGNLNANTIDTDLKAETVAARLLSHGIFPEQLFLKRKGANKRGVLKDISNIEIKSDKNNPTHSAIEIKTNRNGIYDTLPEGLFHQTGNSSRSKSKESILEDIRKRREEEFFIRRFFQPFEEEVDRSHIMTHLKELNFDKKNSAAEFINVFIHFWPVIKHINHRRAAIFLKIVPLSYCIRTNYGQIAKAMTLIFEVPVTIRSNYNTHPIAPNKISRLGSAKLGLNFITAGKLNDRNPDITIEIGPISTKRYTHFCNNGTDEQMLEILKDLFFPANSNLTTKYLINEEEASFTLSNTSNQSKSFLGINTILSKATPPKHKNEPNQKHLLLEV